MEDRVSSPLNFAKLAPVRSAHREAVPEEVVGAVLPQITPFLLPVGRLPVQVDLDERPEILRRYLEVTSLSSPEHSRSQSAGANATGLSSSGWHQPPACTDPLGIMYLGSESTPAAGRALAGLGCPTRGIHLLLDADRVSGAQQRLHGQRAVALPVEVVGPTGRVVVGRGHNSTRAIDVDIVQEELRMVASLSENGGVLVSL